MQHHLEPLACAAVVFRYPSSFTAAGAPGGDNSSWLPHVVNLVSAFLDPATPARWSIERACEHGHLRLLRRLALHEASAIVATDPFYRAFLASKGLVVAVRSDNMEIVQWICCEYCPSVVPVKAMVEAATSGRLRMLQWFYDDKYPSVSPNIYIAERAVNGGHLEVLQWIWSHLNASTEDIARLLASAACIGHLELVQWLHEQLLRLDAAASGFHGDGHGGLVLGSAIENGHFDIAKFLVEHGFALDQRHKRQVRECARAGDLEMIRWLHEKQLVQLPVGWIDDAAASGHLHIVKWVHENVPEDVCTKSAMDQAAKYGHFEIVQWLHANRREGCTTLAMDLAASNDHLEIVQWLHEHRTEGCTHYAMDGAAGNGHLGVVQWLHEHRAEGCTTLAMDDAAGGGFLETVQWLHKHRTEGCTTEAMDLAAMYDHLDVVKWLDENRSEGCTARAMDSANSLETLNWLRLNRAEECSRFVMECPASEGNFEKLLFLKAVVSADCSPRVAVEALVANNFEIFQWVRANYSDHVNLEAVEHEYMARLCEPCTWTMFFQFESSL